MDVFCAGSHAALSGNTLSGNMPSVVTVTQRMRLEEEQIHKFAEELVSLRQRGGVHRTFIGMDIVYIHVIYRYRCVYANRHRYVYIYIYICLFMCMYICIYINV